MIPLLLTNLTFLQAATLPLCNAGAEMKTCVRAVAVQALTKAGNVSMIPLLSTNLTFLQAATLPPCSAGAETKTCVRAAAAQALIEAGSVLGTLLKLMSLTFLRRRHRQTASCWDTQLQVRCGGVITIGAAYENQILLGT